MIGPAFLRQNTGQPKVTLTHILCSNPLLVADEIKDAGLAFNILANNSMKDWRIHDINSSVFISL